VSVSAQGYDHRDSVKVVSCGSFAVRSFSKWAIYDSNIFNTKVTLSTSNLFILVCVQLSNCMSCFDVRDWRCKALSNYFCVVSELFCFLGMSTPLKKRRLTLEPFDSASDVFSSPEHDSYRATEQQSYLSSSQMAVGSLLLGNLFEVCLSACLFLYQIFFVRCQPVWGMLVCLHICM